jgi:RNA polymerase sigma factor (sigma-70 family)
MWITIDLELNNKMTNHKVAALCVGIKKGKRIQEVLPSIAEDMRDGLSIQEIVQKYDLNDPNYLNGLAKVALKCALKGNKYRLKRTYPYKGLMSEDEYVALAQTSKDIPQEKGINPLLKNCTTRHPIKETPSSNRNPDIEKMFDELPSRLSYILRARYFEGMTLQQIAYREGTTRERIRQLEDHALRFLKKKIEIEERE